MSKIGIYPCGYRVLVKPEPIEEKLTPGGMIIAPEKVREDHSAAVNAGRLVAVGHLAWKDDPAPWAKIGDRVMFARYSGREMCGLDGETYRILNDEDITAVLDEGVHMLDFFRKGVAA